MEHQQDVDVEPNSEESTNSSHKNRVQTFPCNVCINVFGTIHGLTMHDMRKHKLSRKILQIIMFKIFHVTK